MSFLAPQRQLTRIKAWNGQRPRSGSLDPESFTITPHGGATMTGDSGFSPRRVAGGGTRKLGLSIQRRLPQLDMAWGWPYVTNLSNLRPIGHGASVYPAPHLKGPNPWRRPSRQDLKLTCLEYLQEYEWRPLQPVSCGDNSLRLSLTTLPAFVTTVV
jgi:hypothetical protein